MFGKLDNMQLEDIPNRIELPLKIAVEDLKRYKSEMPHNLFNLSSRHVSYLKRMFAIIDGMKVNEKTK